MSEYNIKNYTEQGGGVTHIGGKLVFEEGSSVEGLPSSFTPAANQADSGATTIAALKEDFNALLSKLKTAGIMVADGGDAGGNETGGENEAGGGNETGGGNEAGGDINTQG